MDQPNEVITDLEFIFLGGTKLSHTLRECDHYVETSEFFELSWDDVADTARIYKANLLQFGTRMRLVTPVDKTAVQEVVDAIKAQEAKAQGVTGRVQSSTPATAPARPTAQPVPSDLRSRSPLKR